MINRTVRYIFLLLLLLTACQSNRPEEAPLGEDLVVDNGTSNSQSLLFQPTDLDSGWFPETYTQTVPDFESPSQIVAEEQFAVSISAEPLPNSTNKGFRPCCSFYTVSQFLYVYPDEAAAEAVFMEDANRSSLRLGGFSTGLNFEPRIEHLLIGCSSASAPGIDHYQNCRFIAQYGRYFTYANMPVDGQLITLQDWEDLFSAIQERLISQVDS